MFTKFAVTVSAIMFVIAGCSTIGGWSDKPTASIPGNSTVDTIAVTNNISKADVPKPAMRIKE